MRASRLIKMVLLLQTRRMMTAAELAAELEVSERTVARDAQALSEAGVPIYTDRGRSGGYRLVGGYRTRLTGIGRGEAEALFLSGVPSALRDMGLADTASAARLKVSAALSPGSRDAEHSAAQRFHLDAPGWWQPPSTPEVLPALADAVWDDRMVTARYRRRPAAEVERRLEPYGLVLKAGVWYLVARAADTVPGTGTGTGTAAADGTAGGAADRADEGRGGGGSWRIYRADRFTEVTAGGERFARDEEFDLPGFWTERAAAFARSILRETVVLRLSAAGARQLRYVTDRVAADEALARARPEGEPPGRAEGGCREEKDEGGEEGEVTVTLPVESVDVAYSQLLALGPECEVLEPAALRARLRDAAGRTVAMYGAEPHGSCGSAGPPDRAGGPERPEGPEGSEGEAGTPDGDHNDRTAPS